MEGKAKCQMCGKEFTPRRHNQKYCSAECSTEAGRQRSRENAATHRAVFENVCKYCGIKFTTCNKFRNYCCKEHKSLARKPTLSELMEQAEECAMTFREYVAAIKAGKTFEELRRKK